MDAQVRADLEGTLQKVCTNWIGRSHCLQHCMTDFIGHDFGWTGRVHAMREALGFAKPQDMYYWNDTESRTKQEIIDRIEFALLEVPSEVLA